jgi:hypothetical protein
MKIKQFYISLLFFLLPLTMCSWSLKYPDSITVIQHSKSSKSVHKKEKVISKKPKSINFDYGDRTQLSAFLLWMFFGYAGAHWFYMQYYALGALQLSITTSAILLFIFGSFLGLVLGTLLLLALNLWLALDFILILFRLIKLKNAANLIPWRN